MQCMLLRTVSHRHRYCDRIRFILQVLPVLVAGSLLYNFGLCVRVCVRVCVCPCVRVCVR